MKITFFFHHKIAITRDCFRTFRISRLLSRKNRMISPVAFACNTYLSNIIDFLDCSPKVLMSYKKEILFYPKYFIQNFQRTDEEITPTVKNLILTSINLKGPTRLGRFSSPSRSFTCDVNTWIAADVVNPLTRLSARSDAITPNRNKYITNWKIIRSMRQIKD